MTHCWEDHCDDDESYTCLLPEGHDGPHEWTKDTDIQITFVDDARADTTEEARP